MTVLLTFTDTCKDDQLVLTGGQAAGIAIGVILFAALAAGAVAFTIWYLKKKKNEESRSAVLGKLQTLEGAK